MATRVCASFTPALLAPLRGPLLVAVSLIVWTAGAAYCHGYEDFLSGRGSWSGSYVWSAIAVLPWFALFEWSKRPAGRRIMDRPGGLISVLLATAFFSLTLGWAVEAARGDWTPAGLALMRRLPAIAGSLLLILWARAERQRAAPADDVEETPLAGLAPAIDWVEAADNYIELHLGDRVLVRRMTMAAAERVLLNRGFVRIHRRFLVNRARINRIVGTNGSRSVRIGAATLPVGPRYAARLKD